MKIDKYLIVAAGLGLTAAFVCYRQCLNYRRNSNDKFTAPVAWHDIVNGVCKECPGLDLTTSKTFLRR